MAVRTVAAGGGNFNAGATWVGGVAPVAGDDIVANATSGNLTLAANTVSLLTANFTGYTGTLNLQGFQLVFNQASGSTSLTISSGMTITNTSSGYIHIQRNATITSPATAKYLPIRFNGTITITLVNDLYISALTTQNNATTFTGANIYLSQTLISASFVNMKVATPYKFFWIPTATGIISQFWRPPLGHFVFSTTYSISIDQGIEINPASSTTYTSIIEFDKISSWTGSATNYTRNGKPTLGINFDGTANTSLTIINTAGQKIGDLQVYGNNPAATSSIILTHGLECDTISFQKLDYLGGNNTNPTSNITITGTGSMTASYFNMTTTKPTGFSGFVFPGPQPNLLGTSPNGIINVSLSPTLTYNFGTVSILAIPEKRLTLASTVPSTPATVSISNAFIVNTNITDIANVGTNQLAYSSYGNTLLRSTGFSASEPSASGGASSYTFVN